MASQGRQHLSSPSADSGIAESSISFSGLERFPLPPPSLPNTPTTASFGPRSPAHTDRPLVTHTTPLTTPRSRPLPPVGPSNRSDTSARSAVTAQGAYSRELSPYDWHEGASSIDVDATEDRLLSTSFITSLLRENGNASAGRDRPESFASKTYSELSDISYPPTSRLEPLRPHQPLRNVRQQRSQGSSLPPSSFVAIPEASGHASDDSETLHSNQDHSSDLAVIRSASISRRMGYGRPVVAVAPATLHAISSAGEDALRSSHYSNSQELVVNRPGINSDIPYSSLPFSPALPSTAGTQQHFLRDSTNSRHARTETRHSIHSTRSFVPSFISSTTRSITRVFARRKKPLPPVPNIPEVEYRDDRTPLPDLAARADVLHGLLEKGYHPHQSLNTYYETEDKYDKDSGDRTWGRRTPGSPPVGPISPQTWVSPGLPEHTKLVFRSPSKQKPTSRKRFLAIAFGFLVIALAAIGAGIGVALSKKNDALPTCSGSLTGRDCSLNSTCVCTSPVAGRCDGLAQNIVDLTPSVNTLFMANFSSNAVFASIWSAQGSPADTKCTSQSLLLDVSPGLSSVASPNRTRWAQSAILWTLVSSQDLAATEALRLFVNKAPWSQLSSTDAPVNDTSPSFSTTVAGFSYNFASQTVTQPPVAFSSNGQPSSTQMSRVGGGARNALDRMYSFALASSIQRQGALMTYWTSVLQQRPADLTVFLSTLTASPILVPFDASLGTLQAQYAPDTQFPPPPACYPGLNTSQVEQLNAEETMIFGLAAVTPAAKFDSSCYPDRPVYGVIDVLRLRLPFIDSRSGRYPRQALALNREVGPRAIVSAGESLSAFPQSSNVSSKDPRGYGTFNNLNHVVLNYFTSIPDRSLAISLVQFVLGSNGLPPTKGSIIANSLSVIPPLEVAVFGSILPSDISYVVSNFTDSSGSLFFGSAASSKLRDWAIQKTSHTIVWADGSLAPLIARDSTLSDNIFQQIFGVASKAISSGVAVAVTTITDSLQSNGKMSST